MNFFPKLDLYKTKTDYSLFVLVGKIMFIAICVGSLLLFGQNINPRIDNIMQNLQDGFWITDLDNISQYLSIEVDVDLYKKTITLWQFTYLFKILRGYSITDYRLATISITTGVINSLISIEDQVDKSIVTWYQSVISNGNFYIAGYTFLSRFS